MREVFAFGSAFFLVEGMRNMRNLLMRRLPPEGWSPWIGCNSLFHKEQFQTRRCMHPLSNVQIFARPVLICRVPRSSCRSFDWEKFASFLCSLRLFLRDLRPTCAPVICEMFFINKIVRFSVQRSCRLPNHLISRKQHRLSIMVSLSHFCYLLRVDSRARECGAF
jgi:hypothetical protein